MKNLTRICLTLLLIVLPNLEQIARAESAPANFLFTGSGYGHGVGMSQIGARAKALGGESATAILQYYYSGTQVETTTDTQILKINIGHLLTSAKVKSDSAQAELQLFTGNLPETETAAAILIIPSKTVLSFDLKNSQILVTTKQGKKVVSGPIGKSFTLRWSGTRSLIGPDSLVSLTTDLGTTHYRYGQMQFKIIKDKTLGNRLEVINSVRLQDEYLWGVGEVPSSWPTQALQAQAIASRTYAIAKSTKIRSACDCHLYNSISDQTFVGSAKISEGNYGQFWKAAVESTTGLIVTYGGVPITAYFSSSTGGVTESAEYAWGRPLPYALSVPDSSSADVVLNPRFATWSREISQKVMASTFLLPDVISLKVLSLNPTGTVALIQGTSSSGVSVVLKGETFRSRSKLPSAWFLLKN